MSLTVVRIENNTLGFIFLPPTINYPRGFRLLPGLNSIPERYMAELKSYAVPNNPKFEYDEVTGEERKVPGGIRRPGLEALEALQKPVVIRRIGTESFGPQITIHRDPLVDREDGPPPPVSLPGDAKAAALIIASTTDLGALKRWTKDKRLEVSQAAEARMLAVQGTKRG